MAALQFATVFEISQHGSEFRRAVMSEQRTALLRQGAVESPDLLACSRRDFDSNRSPVFLIPDAPHTAGSLETVQHGGHRPARQPGRLRDAARAHRASLGQDAETSQVGAVDSQPRRCRRVDFVGGVLKRLYGTADGRKQLGARMI